MGISMKLNTEEEEFFFSFLFKVEWKKRDDLQRPIFVLELIQRVSAQWLEALTHNYLNG